MSPCAGATECGETRSPRATWPCPSPRPAGRPPRPCRPRQFSTQVRRPRTAHTPPPGSPYRTLRSTYQPSRLLDPVKRSASRSTWHLLGRCMLHASSYSSLPSIRGDLHPPTTVTTPFLWGHTRCFGPCLGAASLFSRHWDRSKLKR